MLGLLSKKQVCETTKKQVERIVELYQDVSMGGKKSRRSLSRDFVKSSRSNSQGSKERKKKVKSSIRENISPDSYKRNIV